MKVRMVFESSGPYMLILSEDEKEDAILRGAFGECELRAKVEYERAYGGGGYPLYTDRRASVKVTLFAGS